MEISKDMFKKISKLIIVAGIVVFAVMNYKVLLDAVGFFIGVLSPFILGAAIAFIINVPMSFLERTVFKKAVVTKKDSDGHLVTRKKKYVRPLSMIITLLVVALLVVGIIVVVVPQLGTAVVELVKTANNFFPKAKEWAEDMFKNNEVIRGYIDFLNISPEKIMSSVVEFVKNGAGGVFSNAMSAAQAVVSGGLAFIIGIVFSCYLLMKKEKVVRQINMLQDAILPEKAAKKTKYVIQKCVKTFSQFISGQCLEALILGSLYFIILMPIGMPYALLISVLMAFLALIPVIGVFVGGVVGTFIVFMENPVMALVFLIIFIIVQNVDGNFIYPRVVGNSIGLPAMWVLVAVTVGSSLMGVVGMLIFIPLSSVIYSLVSEWTYERLGKKRIPIERYDDVRKELTTDQNNVKG